MSIPSQEAGRRLLVENISNENLILFSGVQLKGNSSVDVFLEDPSITDERALSDMENPLGSLYIETSINNRVRVIDFDPTSVEAPDLIYGHRNKIVFRRDLSAESLITPLTTVESGNTLYVNSESGLDTASGTQSDPLKTIKEGINRFLPPGRPAPEWSSSTVKRIIVQYTPGMAVLKESIIKPPHTGAGLLIIEGEMETQETLTQLGSAVTVSGYEGRNIINFTTSGLTPSALEGSFIEPDPDIIFGTTEFYSYLEHFAIVDNDASSVTLAAGKIGSTDGFGFNNNATLNVVKAQVPIGLPDLDQNDIGPFVTFFTNQGGGVLFKGFQWTGSSSAFNSFISDTGAHINFVGGYTTYVDQCHFINAGYIASSCNSLLINSCFMESNGGNNSIRIAGGNNIVHLDRSYIKLTGAELDFSQTTFPRIRFCYFNRVSGGSVHVRSTLTLNTQIINCDFRGGVNLQYNTCSQSSIQNCSFEDCSNPCIEILGRSGVTLDNCIGSSNNTNHGIQIGEASYVQETQTNNTVTGSLGDIKVGEQVAINWSGVPSSDTVTFSRIE